VTSRSLRHVPRWVHGLLAIALMAQLAWYGSRGAPRATAQDLPRPPPAGVLRLASVGEPQALAQLLTLYIQAFDYQPGTRIPYRDLDYHRLVAWLGRILELDPAGQYPLMLATRVYAEVPDRAKARLMLEFAYEAYLRDPEHRWPALAHAALAAKHQLKDLPLALKYAHALQANTHRPDAPLWVKQMEAFILEDMNELEAARVLQGGLIASGQVKDARDLRLLQERLEALEAKIKARDADVAGENRRESDGTDGNSTGNPPKTP
jgi:hypothetical protein